MTRFQQHHDIDRVEKDAGPLLREHPESEIELSKFVAATVLTRPMPNKKEEGIFAFYNDRGDHGTSGEKRTYTARERKVISLEDEMYDIDVRFHTIESALAATKKLILENSDKDGKGKIMMGRYFSVLNVRCLKELELDDFLLHEAEARNQVIENSKIIEFYLTMTLNGLGEVRKNMNESVKEKLRSI